MCRKSAKETGPPESSQLLDSLTLLLLAKDSPGVLFNAGESEVDGGRKSEATVGGYRCGARVRVDDEGGRGARGLNSRFSYTVSF